jgi:hypothetical protein
LSVERASCASAAGANGRSARRRFPARFVTPWAFEKKLDGFDVDRVDVVLRGNRALAVTQDSLSAELWDGEIVMRDVPVAWAPGLEHKRVPLNEGAEAK